MIGSIRRECTIEKFGSDRAFKFVIDYVRRFGHVINKDGVLGTHNHLFVGSDGGSARWATVCSLSATAKLNNVEPFSVASWNIAHSSDASSSES